MKNSNDSFGNISRDLPACSAMPEPTATAVIRKGRVIPYKGKTSENYNFFTLSGISFREHNKVILISAIEKRTNRLGKMQTLVASVEGSKLRA
jgi:hypothetical protein